MSITAQVYVLTEIIFDAIALGLALPSTILFIECIAALFPTKQEQTHTTHAARIDVLVPAHNEATVIGSTLEQLQRQLTPQDRLIVIADNCNDTTATIAQQFGATVLERHDPVHRGKGYALDYALQFLKSNPPEVVVVVDADCNIAPGTIKQIAQRAVACDRPVQATYLMQASNKPGIKDSLSTLAITVKNLVRPTGLNRLGLPCLLTGSGMAFPWSVLCQVSLASSKTVDDMQLAIDLAMAGYAPIYCQEARITGRLMQQDAAKSQRTRWEHGHLETLFNQVPRLLSASMRQKQLDLLALALEISVPPLSLLIVLWAAAMTGALFTGILGSSWHSSALLAIEGLMITSAIFAAWVKFARTELNATTLLAAPLYILWKMPLYLTFLVRPQTQWLRTERDSINAIQL